MTRRLPTLLTAALLLLAVVSALAQDAQPDRWRELAIDQATPDDAIKTLGKPESDKVDRLRIFDIDPKWVSRKQTEKIFRKLKFKGIEGFKYAELSFLEDKLVMIDLVPEKKIDASGLSTIYGITFEPRFSTLDRSRKFFHPDPGNFPSVYYLHGSVREVFIGAMIGNVGLGAALRASTGLPDSDTHYPGKVGQIQIVSRTLENKDAADLLK
jgi:hypothetical protein